MTEPPSGPNNKRGRAAAWLLAIAFVVVQSICFVLYEDGTSPANMRGLAMVMLVLATWICCIQWIAFAGRNLAQGILLGMLAAVACGALQHVTFAREELVSDYVSLFYLELTPFMCFAFALPGILLRGLFGWRLAHKNGSRDGRTTLGEMLLVVPAIAVLSEGVRGFFETKMEPPKVSEIAIASGVVFGVGLFLCLFIALSYWLTKLSPKRFWILATACGTTAVALPLCVATYLNFRLQNPNTIRLYSTLLGISLGPFAIYATWWLLGLRVISRRENQAATKYRIGRWPYAASIALAASAMLMHLHVDRTKQAISDFDEVKTFLRDRGADWTSSSLKTGGSVPEVISIDFGTRKVSDDELAVLEKCPNCRVLELLGAPLTRAGLNHLRHTPDLALLSLSDLDIDDQDLAALSHLTKLRHLEVLNTDVSSFRSMRLSRLHHLRLLDVSGTNVTTAGLKDIAGIPLNSLSVSGTKIDDGFLKALRENPHLDDLEISNTQTTDVGIAALSNQVELNRFKINGTKVTGTGFASWPIRSKDEFLLIADDSQLRDISVLAKFRSASLTAANCQITDSSLAFLRESTCNIEELILDGNSITDVGLEHLALARGIEALHLAGTDVTGSGFANWDDNDSLALLDLSGTMVNDQNLEQIAKFKDLTLLLLNNTNVTVDGLRRYADSPHRNPRNFGQGIEIGGTKISLKELNEIELNTTYFVEKGRFSPAEIAKYPQLRINVGLRRNVSLRSPCETR